MTKVLLFPSVPYPRLPVVVPRKHAPATEGKGDVALLSRPAVWGRGNTHALQPRTTEAGAGNGPPGPVCSPREQPRPPPPSARWPTPLPPWRPGRASARVGVIPRASVRPGVSRLPAGRLSTGLDGVPQGPAAPAGAGGLPPSSTGSRATGGLARRTSPQKVTRQ